jgi:hypothetical protein
VNRDPSFPEDPPLALVLAVLLLGGLVIAAVFKLL